MDRGAIASWNGTNGGLTTDSGALINAPFSTAARFELEATPSATTPEELLAAAYASCFTMTLAERLAAAIPDLGLGADVIVGHPGEEEADFEATMALVRELPFSYLHVFAYSDRKGTEAAKMGHRAAASAIRERSSKLRALGVSGTKRMATLPEVPTIAEAGVPGYEFTTWHGLWAPKNTPRNIVALLNDRLKKTMAAPDQQKRFHNRGLDVIASSPEEFAAFVQSEYKKWGRVIKERGMKAE